MKFKMSYFEGYPAGWTDDLGIIADRNQWVEGQDPGWYCQIYNLFASEMPLVNEMYIWCKNTLRNRWDLRGAGFYFEDEKDAIMFSLRWSNG